MLNKKWLALCGTALGAFMIAIDFTIVNTILANIQRDLHATMGELQWVMAGFGVFFCTFLVTMGRAADIIGRRLVFYTAIIGFGLCSLGAGLAQVPWQLILFRVLQGGFAAAAFPSGLAITVNAFPEQQEQSRALGIYNSILGMGLAIGPVVAGFITSALNWRWVFFINVPAIMLALVICYFSVDESKLEEEASIDWRGFVFITLFVALLAFGINESPVYGWLSPLILGSFALAFLSLAALVWAEKKSLHPLLPARLFKNHSFALASIVSIILIQFAWPLLFLIPLYLSLVLNYSILSVGTLLLPMTIMTVIVPAIAGFIYARRGPVLIISSGFALMFLSLILQLFFNIDTPLVTLMLAFMAFGAAWGVGNGLYGPISLSSPETKKNAGTVTGALITVLNISGVLFLSLGITLFRHFERMHLFSSLAKTGITINDKEHAMIETTLASPEMTGSLIKQMLLPNGQSILLYFKHAFVYAYHDLMAIFLVLALFGLVLASILLKKLQQEVKVD